MKGEFIVNQEGERFDVLFNANQPALSRSHIKNLINEGKILLNGKKVKAGEKVKLGQKVTFEFEQPKPLEAEAEKIDFGIVYEDSDLLVVNKPQGLVVHPCSSTKSGTLVNGLLDRVKDLSGINVPVAGRNRVLHGLGRHRRVGPERPVTNAGDFHPVV